MYQQQLQQESIELGNKRNQTRLLESINDLSLQQKQQLLINILQIPRQERKAEILQLMRIIVMKVDFFHQFQVENIDNEAYDYCLRHLTFEAFSKNTVIFEKGDYPHNMYVVLRGQVSIYQNDYQLDQKMTKKHSLPVDQARECSPTNRTKFSDFTMKSLVRLTEFKDWKTFGEQAILDQRMRTNFAVCDVDSTLAILSKENYTIAVQILEKKKELYRMNNFKLNPSFQGLNRKLINIMLFTYQSSDYKFRDIVYKQGQTDSDIIYIIKQGEFLVYQDQRLNEYQQMKVRKQIAIMTTGEIFGDYEAFERITRQFNVQCNSHTGSLIIIPLQSLSQKLSQFNEQHYIQQLKSLCLKKNKWYHDFKTNIEQTQGKYSHFFTIQEQKSNNANGSSNFLDSPSKIINDNKQFNDASKSISPIQELKNTLNYLTSIDDQTSEQLTEINQSINLQKIKNKNTIYVVSPDKLQPLPKVQLVSSRQKERSQLSTPDRFKQVIKHKMTILKRMHNLSPEDSVNMNTLQQKTIYVQLPKQVKLEQNIEKHWPIKATLYLNDLDNRIRYHSNNQKMQNCNSSRDSSVVYEQFSMRMDGSEQNSQRTSRMGILNNILQHSVTKRGKNKKKRALTLKYREYLESQFQEKTQNSLHYS
ncbi:unnamed protein product (macronuclear) [Paramecium tetraurelia]|uniref:Cyclic nucleotide-binding domain-containing protein n=1 Tax=Paramecium tetraurelia TaxID=5888 RepID=A0CZD7_PARTE|nr:uncharacterized protein GSPATT00011727001 [Paramecium tetraurelia]CAK76154.1 unnamed protein product [Paramecium tetraurelia]|eukprot:XP_001443551.1 hypothetical protein (macronuclear) [Paramecium tetraurelia strain d4-2]